MTIDLNNEDASALAQYLHRKLDDERYPLAPRLEPLESDPRQAGIAEASAGTAAAAETDVEPSVGRRRRR